ncbi:transmembrane protein 6/97 [Bisporella sp. PMI_857]|nr:transmembrane protein 6/97 [Bisporella sp. PMI_857]
MATSIFSRKRDLLWLTWILVTIPNMLLMDFQGLYPVHLVPDFMKRISTFYVETYKDQFFVHHPPFFTAFLVTEVVFQLPVCLWAVPNLLKGAVLPGQRHQKYFPDGQRPQADPGIVRIDSPKVPLVLFPYAFLVFLTTAVCMYEYSQWAVPLQQKLDLTTLYGPFLALAGFMMVDMYFRLNAIINKATAAALAGEEKKKL